MSCTMITFIQKLMCIFDQNYFLFLLTIDENNRFLNGMLVAELGVQ